MNNCSATKNGGVEEKRDERGRRLPVRINELLGLSKSGGKMKIVDGPMIERPRSQPVRIKDLLESMSSCKKPNPSARRLTTAPSGMTNARRQLYEGTSNCVSPDKTFSTRTELQSSGNKLATGPQGRMKSMPVHLLGVSKSEGKNMRINGNERLQPERIKDCMASWEKSQTVKQQARQSIMGNLRTTNVRRKLYNVPSPMVAQKITRKSLAPHKINFHKASTAAQRKSIKPEPKKSVKSQSRKSCLLPPNSIRDKHINRQSIDESIKEESPASLLNDAEVSKTKISKSPQSSPPIVENLNISHNRSFDTNKTSKSSQDRSSSEKQLKHENSWINDDKKLSADSSKVPRATVIMAVSSEKFSFQRSQSSSPKSSDSKKSSFTVSRPPLQELKSNSLFPQQRLDAMTSSLEDLLGNSRFNNGESFRTSNLPYNSFLDAGAETQEKSLTNVDQQTLSWMHANLSLTIRSTEENLFSMKQMLRTLEEIRDKKSSIDETMESIMKVRDEAVVVDEKLVDDKSSMEFCQRKTSVITVEQNLHDNAEQNDKENVFEDENSKSENKSGGRRRSARLAGLRTGKSPKNLDDSFSQIERELNIFHDNTKATSPRMDTPKERKKIDPRSRRSMREYMALKSMVNCLQTPDVKRLSTPKGDKDTPAQRLTIKRALSRLLLNELDDLYAESPQ